jgi:two-component system sensor kinase FixL
VSVVTIVWSMAAAGALVLGGVHLLIWRDDRQARASLAFAVLTVALAGVAFTELGMMHAQGPVEWGRWVLWCHLPLFLLIVGTALFVRLYLDAGRWWLLATIAALRLAILVANFAAPPNFNFSRIDGVERIPFLGGQVTVVSDATASPWQWVATLAGVLFLVFVLDALVTVWRRGTTDDRRKAVLIAGSVAAFLALAYSSTQLVIWGVLELPMLITPAFLVPLAAMTYELSRDALRASRLARELLESERSLDLAAESAGLGVCTWTPSGAWATRRARSLFGLAEHEALDVDRIAGMVHRDDIEHLRAAAQQAFVRGGDSSMHFRIVLPDGTERWILARGRAEVSGGGRLPTLRGVLRDVTDQKTSETEAEELRRELAHIGRVTALGQLASALAHELSQPLGAILRNAEAAELLLRCPSPDLAELRAIVTDIHRDDRRAGEVIERLRGLLQRRQLRFEPVTVDSLVRDVSALVRPDATARHIQLECDVDADLPLVSGDRVHLSQVLLNLLINALDATTDTKRARHVLVEARSVSRRSVELVVTDHGSGIPADRLSRIFEPFYTTKPAGMGMGLAVSRTIVEAHGGRLWAENVVDGGARFRVVLPTDGSIAA